MSDKSKKIYNKIILIFNILFLLAIVALFILRIMQSWGFKFNYLHDYDFYEYMRYVVIGYIFLNQLNLLFQKLMFKDEVMTEYAKRIKKLHIASIFSVMISLAVFLALYSLISVNSLSYAADIVYFIFLVLCGLLFMASLIGEYVYEYKSKHIL